MKTTVVVAAALLALGGSAIAQQYPNETLGQKADRVFDRAEDATQRAVNPPQGEESLGRKAGRVFDRMEAGTQRAWDQVSGRHEPAPQAEVRDDTRAMGAGPAKPRSTREAAREADARTAAGTDAGRRARMDDAYRNWQSRQ